METLNLHKYSSLYTGKLNIYLSQQFLHQTGPDKYKYSFGHYEMDRKNALQVFYFLIRDEDIRNSLLNYK